MCNAVSGITRSDGTVFMPDPKAVWNHSHTEIAKLHGIPDGLLGDKYARWECTPKDGNYQSDPATWTFRLDEQRAPGWWADDAVAFEDKVRRETERFMLAANEAATSPGSSRSATGHSGSASATGRQGSASATGDWGIASATGRQGSASATGDWGSASATGDWGIASATGDWGIASATGHSGSASATGDQGSASATGYESTAVSVGYNGRVRAGPNGVLVCAERSSNWKLIGWAIGIVGENGILPNTWYKAEGKKLVVADDEITREADRKIAAAAAAREAAKTAAIGGAK